MESRESKGWKPPRLLAVTDRTLCLPGQFLSEIEELYRLGVALQLREKSLSIEEFTPLAQQVSQIAQRYQVPFDINVGREKAEQRLRLALELNAVGIQIPEKSISVKRARELGRGQLRIGRSIHQKTMAEMIKDDLPDFFIAAPIWAPKDKSGSPLGLKGLEKICRQFSVPVLALGGVTPDNVAEVVSAGAWGAAVRSGVWGLSSENVREKIGQYLSAWPTSV